MEFCGSRPVAQAIWHRIPCTTATRRERGVGCIRYCFADEDKVKSAVEMVLHGEDESMEIMFSMKIKKDGKTVQVLMLCTECRGELEMAQAADRVRFRCRKHGELGTLTIEEVTDGLRQAQERAAEQYGLGKVVRMKVTPAEPTVQ